MSFDRRHFLKALVAGAALAGISTSGLTRDSIYSRPPTLPPGATHWQEPIKMHRADMARCSQDQQGGLFAHKLEQAKRRMRVALEQHGTKLKGPTELVGPFPMQGGGAGEQWHLVGEIAA